MKGNYSRRLVDREGMSKWRKKCFSGANPPKKRRIIRTGNRIRKMSASTEAMLSARDSAKGNLEATIVYIDLLSNLPYTTEKAKPYSLPNWRGISDQATVCFYHLGAATIEKQSDFILVPFTFNLSQGLWEAARDSNQPDLTYLQHRIKTSLKRTLNRSPEFWFAYEVNNVATISGKPHLHGALLIKSNEAIKVRNAFHQLNSEVSTDFKRHALIFSSGKRKQQIRTHGELYANLNWPLYSMKEMGIVRHYFLIGQKTYTATRGITKAAKKYLNQLTTKPACFTHTENIYRKSAKSKDELFGSWA